MATRLCWRLGPCGAAVLCAFTLAGQRQPSQAESYQGKCARLRDRVEVRGNSGWTKIDIVKSERFIVKNANAKLVNAIKYAVKRIRSRIAFDVSKSLVDAVVVSLKFSWAVAHIFFSAVHVDTAQVEVVVRQQFENRNTIVFAHVRYIQAIPSLDNGRCHDHSVFGVVCAIDQAREIHHSGARQWRKECYSRNN